MDGSVLGRHPPLPDKIQRSIDTKAAITQSYRQLRVAAYCRVSTKQDEQLNSYEVQRTHYEERIKE